MRLRPVPTLIHDQPHRRLNPLTGEWVLVSPHRTQRPWQGKIESVQPDKLPSYDPQCYLCPGNRRASGEVNPIYTGVHSFDNDFSALIPGLLPVVENEDLFLRRETAQGICRVLCFSPRHDQTLALMSVEDIRRVVELWIDQMSELSHEYRWVQIFENRGEIMGCSNAHPHGQLWAGNALPNEPYKENSHQLHYWNERKSVLLLDYLERESNKRVRIVIENEHWVALVPFWAIWPFEILLLPRRHVRGLTELEALEQHALAEVMKRLLIRYDNLFHVSFPYTMGWHGAPNGEGDFSHWQLHAHFYPPLLRSASVKKFMVGYELLSEPQRDITAEAAAERLRSLADVHYTLAPEDSSV
jgi:UDPglucose--hexose-1-phosphate uridylyltransferase